jgi:hypothetical protein
LNEIHDGGVIGVKRGHPRSGKKDSRYSLQEISDLNKWQIKSKYCNTVNFIVQIQFLKAKRTKSMIAI